ncbi:MAG: hypothetical protein GY953_09645 [bacterium]|nr:hypothetical protein [bacterium]
MHGGFACFSREMNGLMRRGAKLGKVDGLLDRAGGKLVARGLAVAIEGALCVAMRYSALNRKQSARADEFFRENFEIRDPFAPNRIRYYQGRILVRTARPEDDMNVYLKFCPDPDSLFRKGLLGWARRALFGTTLNPLAVVSTKVLSEEEAQRIEQDPDQVDLVISFKDAGTIVGLVGRTDLDMGDLLVDNVVQMKGNTGHLFKFGAIAKNIELALGGA